MGQFQRRRGQVVLTLDAYEIELLLALFGELTGLLQEGLDEAPGPSSSDDPFAVWEQSFSTEPTLEDPDFLDPDPITRRLFPDAYHDDPAASADFRRYTDGDARRAKLDAIEVVLDDLRKADRAGRIEVPAAHHHAWMTSLNNLRLVLSVVLGITDEISADEAAKRPDSDPKGVIHHYYSWLGWLLESLMSAITGD
ncbi:DUF2017 domain-containing protein [Aestuariimicrobium ganziense]|uniref:DUF2017 domain-containing protein n=1 Tax=Aestuariimicrobium ganziense TaxID=2773677 RepID=UPI0019455654|nr:DUF2017 domain-containing protein [Aestuariimicrobium ganziense]